MTGEAAARAQLMPERVDLALRRLAIALDRLEAASERHAKARAARANLEEELAVMQDDRARLAVELDGAMARVRALELANEEALRRLACAMGNIRAVLGDAGACQG